MTNTQNLIRKKENDLEILNGFFIIKEYLKQRGVNLDTIENIHNEVRIAYYKHNSFKFPFKLLPNNILYVDGKKIQLEPSKLNAGTNYVNPSGIYNQQDGFQLDGLTSTLSNSGDPTLVGIATGLKLIDGLGLDIETNVNNVLTYGINSWGATTNPKGIQIKIDELAIFVQNTLSQQVPDLALTTFNRELKRLLTYYKHIRANHANATSTKKAYDAMIDALTSFISKENEIVSQLKKSGYDFKITQDTALGVTNIFTDTSGHTVGSDAHNKKNPFKTSYNLYTLLSVPQDQPAVVTTEANPNYNPNLPVSAINQPTVAAKKSNGLTTAALISAAIFGLKAIL